MTGMVVAIEWVDEADRPRRSVGFLLEDGEKVKLLAPDQLVDSNQWTEMWSIPADSILQMRILHFDGILAIKDKYKNRRPRCMTCKGPNLKFIDQLHHPGTSMLVKCDCGKSETRANAESLYLDWTAPT